MQVDFYGKHIVWCDQKPGTHSQCEDYDSYNCTIVSVGFDMIKECAYLKFKMTYEHRSDNQSPLPEESTLTINDVFFTSPTVDYTVDNRVSRASSSSSELEGCFCFEIDRFRSGQ